MRRHETVVQELASNWPYVLALVPLAAMSFEPLILCLLILALVYVIRRKDQRLDELSVTDKLTGLFNSRYLRTELDRQVALAHRARSPLSMIFIDVDNLKAVNDRHGHAAGDRLLYLLGQGMQLRIRTGMDLAFRFGGDEFLVLCPQTRLSTARAIAARILRFPATLNGRGATLSLSVVTLREGEAPIDFLRRADRLLYEAKRAGKNRLACEAGPERCAPTTAARRRHESAGEGPSRGPSFAGRGRPARDAARRR